MHTVQRQIGAMGVAKACKLGRSVHAERLSGDLGHRRGHPGRRLADVIADHLQRQRRVRAPSVADYLGGAPIGRPGLLIPYRRDIS